MAQPVNLYSSTDMVGIRENFGDAIYDISPKEVPLLTAMQKVKATARKYEWQEDALRAATASNANIEGADITPPAVTPTTRRDNQVQTFVEAVTVTDLDNSLKKAGRGADLAREIKRKVQVLKLDANLSLYQNQAKVVGTDSVAGRFAALQSWFTTNTSGGAGASDPTGDGSDTRSAGTPRALTQTIFEASMQSAWEAGGKPDQVFLEGDQMNVVVGFTGYNNQRTTLAASSGKVINTIEVFQTPFGEVTFKLDRNCPDTTVFLMDMSMWAIAELQGMRNYALAKTGMAEKRAMDWTFTLESRNQAGSALIADLS